MLRTRLAGCSVNYNSSLLVLLFLFHLNFSVKFLARSGIQRHMLSTERNGINYQTCVLLCFQCTVIASVFGSHVDWIYDVLHLFKDTSTLFLVLFCRNL